jgi:hypothetical protein
VKGAYMVDSPKGVYRHVKKHAPNERTSRHARGFPLCSFCSPVWCSGRDSQGLSVTCYPQRYCSGLSIKGIEALCLMPFCVFVPDGLSGIYALNHPPMAGRFYATHTDHASTRP